MPKLDAWIDQLIASRTKLLGLISMSGTSTESANFPQLEEGFRNLSDDDFVDPVLTDAQVRGEALARTLAAAEPRAAYRLAQFALAENIEVDLSVRPAEGSIFIGTDLARSMFEFLTPEERGEALGNILQRDWPTVPDFLKGLDLEFVTRVEDVLAAANYSSGPHFWTRPPVMSDFEVFQFVFNSLPDALKDEARAQLVAAGHERLAASV